MRSQDEIFYYGMISLWENVVLPTWKVDTGIYDDLRHFQTIWVRLNGPLTANNLHTACKQILYPKQEIAVLFRHLTEFRKHIL